MTTITYTPEDYCIRASGHSGFAEAGSDIVCAGVTALMRALLDAAEADGYWRRTYVCQSEAVIAVECDPEPRVQRECRAVYDAIAGGLRLIAQNYPEHVKFYERSVDNA